MKQGILEIGDKVHVVEKCNHDSMSCAFTFAELEQFRGHVGVVKDINRSFDHGEDDGYIITLQLEKGSEPVRWQFWSYEVDLVLDEDKYNTDIEQYYREIIEI